MTMNGGQQQEQQQQQQHLSSKEENDMITIRLYLVRHGETEANKKKLVVGQSDSPLTEQGIEQAKALGRYKSQWLIDDNNMIQPQSFWRIYSSDLQRAKHTTQLVLSGMSTTTTSASSSSSSSLSLNMNDETILTNKNNVRYDRRLREIAKGARQGFPKIWSYERAMEERYKSITTKNNNQINNELNIPLLENEDDGFRRASEWLSDIIHDIIQDYQTTKRKTNNADNNNNSSSNDNNDDHETNNCYKKKTYRVLAIAHAGVYRVFLNRLLTPERVREHPNARYDPLDGRFVIPNTSLTILDIHINNALTKSSITTTISTTTNTGNDYNNNNVDEKIENLSSLTTTINTHLPKNLQSVIGRIDIVLLTGTEHYLEAEKVLKKGRRQQQQQLDITTLSTTTNE